MKVYLTFDIEIWCNSWEDLDTRFPASFQRYIYGRSPSGEYALPKTLEILDNHGLKGVFFVEPLFAGRFGVEHLAVIVELIRAGKHEIQLHLHPEWTDEIRPLLFAGATGKRQHLSYYTLEEQCVLLSYGRQLLATAGCNQVDAFRAGSFACNADTYRALRRSAITVDSSINAVHPACGLDLRETLDFTQPQELEGVRILPLTVFRDGFGKLRPAQIGACSFPELRGALVSAADSGTRHFVILSHNFEMLRSGQSAPDTIVVRRFEQLCAFLAAQRDRFEVSTLFPAPEIDTSRRQTSLAHASMASTLQRHGEQLARRLSG
ncbi:MAG TPA: polysaccharide deacetylase [Candidatus Accumulibacter sp.]|nr:polysaccharide deacetylase [Accumulibacter sp.]